MKNYFTKDDDKLKWQIGESKSLLKTRVFEITSSHNKYHSGVEGDYVLLNAPNWVIVIPKIDNKFLMVKQWRHGLKDLSIEFPGGVIDEGEDELTAAKRELQEETGYKAKKFTKLGSLNPNPALNTNKVHIFLADDLEKVGNQELDHDEFINVMELPIEEVIEGIGTPQFPHAIMGTAVALYLKNNR